MSTAIDRFLEGTQRVRDLHSVHDYLLRTTTSAIDLSDILRAEIVLSVSAFDSFIHELTHDGMLECFHGIRPRTRAFNNFPIPIGVTGEKLTADILATEIRKRHGFQSFQQPDRVADAVRLFSEIDLWNCIAKELGLPQAEAKQQLSLIIDRRNKIAHEADRDPSYPGQRWPIERNQVDFAIDLLERIGKAVSHCTSR